jgi:hypothetical protein
MSLTLPNLVLFGTTAAMAFSTNLAVNTRSNLEQLKKNTCMNWYLFAAILGGFLYSLVLMPSRLKHQGAGELKFYAISVAVIYIVLLALNSTVLASQYEAERKRTYTVQSVQKINLLNHALLIVALLAFGLMLVPSLRYTLKK